MLDPLAPSKHCPLLPCADSRHLGGHSWSYVGLLCDGVGKVLTFSVLVSGGLCGNDAQGLCDASGVPWDMMGREIHVGMG